MVSKKEEVLRQVRIVRKEKKMSYQTIMDTLAKDGCPLALSSIRRVFDERYHANDFKYETTLKPIVRVVLGLDEDFDDPETSALAAVVDYKDSLIEHLQEQAAKLRHGIKALAITAIIMGAIIVLAAVVLEAYIVLDIDHPEWGLFFN